MHYHLHGVDGNGPKSVCIGQRRTGIIMDSKLKDALIGAGAGAVIGCVLAGARVVSALCPASWPVSAGVAGGMLANDLSDGDNGWTVVGAAAGVGVGLASIPFAPVWTPWAIVTAPTAIPACAAIGAVVGYVDAVKQEARIARKVENNTLATLTEKLFKDGYSSIS